METFTEPWQARENTFFLSLEASCNINRYVLDLVYITIQPNRPYFCEKFLTIHKDCTSQQIEQERGKRKKSLVKKIDISLVFLVNQYLMKQTI